MDKYKNNKIQNLILSWKKRSDYLGDKKNTPLYNVWRSFMFTKKGKKIGHCKEWNKFLNFYKDMGDSYSIKMRLGRLDKNKYFCKENCIWMTNSDLSISKYYNSPILKYNNVEKTLREWSIIYNIPYNGIKQRYYKGKNYTSKEIIFGRLFKKPKKIKDIKELNKQQQRAKISKMISSYRCKDKKHNFECDLDIDWFINNISNKKCIYCNCRNNIGCDRINNKIGHIKDNVIPCCYICNVTRQNNFNIDEMKQIGKVIKNINKKRIEMSNSI